MKTNRLLQKLVLCLVIGVAVVLYVWFLRNGVVNGEGKRRGSGQRAAIDDARQTGSKQPLKHELDGNAGMHRLEDADGLISALLDTTDSLRQAEILTALTFLAFKQPDDMAQRFAARFLSLHCTETIVEDGTTFGLGSSGDQDQRVTFRWNTVDYRGESRVQGGYFLFLFPVTFASPFASSVPFAEFARIVNRFPYRWEEFEDVFRIQLSVDALSSPDARERAMSFWKFAVAYKKTFLEGVDYASLQDDNVVAKLTGTEGRSWLGERRQFDPREFSRKYTWASFTGTLRGEYDYDKLSSPFFRLGTNDDFYRRLAEAGLEPNLFTAYWLTSQIAIREDGLPGPPDYTLPLVQTALASQGEEGLKQAVLFQVEQWATSAYKLALSQFLLKHTEEPLSLRWALARIAESQLKDPMQTQGIVSLVANNKFIYSTDEEVRIQSAGALYRCATLDALSYLRIMRDGDPSPSVRETADRYIRLLTNK